jgi:predicted AAA+ superfamily ATPase
VDFVDKSGLDVGGLVQVCWDLSGKVEGREVRGLAAAMEHFNLKKSTIITEDTLKEELVRDMTIKFVPLWLWLLK